MLIALNLSLALYSVCQGKLYVTNPDEATEESAANLEKMKRAGLRMLDADWYKTCRLHIKYTLLALIVDEFYEKVLGAPHTSPFGRLSGCRVCGAGCQSSAASNCKVCELSWWCSLKCRRSGGHSEATCPVGAAQMNTVPFDGVDGAVSFDGV